MQHPIFYVPYQPTFYQRKAYKNEKRYINNGKIVLKTNDISFLSQTSNDYIISVELCEISELTSDAKIIEGGIEGESIQEIDKISGEAIFKIGIMKVNKNSCYSIKFCVSCKFRDVESKPYLIDSIYTNAFKVVSQYKNTSTVDQITISVNTISISNVPLIVELGGDFRKKSYEIKHVEICGLIYEIIYNDGIKLIVQIQKNSKKKVTDDSVWLISKEYKKFLGKVILKE
jgi:hypothetical protein